MHSAPAVTYPVGRCRFHAGLLAGLLVMGAGVLVTWVQHDDAIAMRHAAAGLLWLICALAVVRLWWRSPTGSLTWDGQLWTWAGEGGEPYPVALSMTLDSQTALLLRLQADGAPSLWVWLEQRRAPARWLPCRRAVFGPKPPATVTDPGWVAP